MYKLTINEYRTKFQPKYVYFAHYNIKLNEYDEEVQDNLISIIDSNFSIYNKIKDLGPSGLDFIVYNTHSPNYISKNDIEDTLGEYEDTYTFEIEPLGCPNLYKDAKWFLLDYNELVTKEELEEMWNNSFVGYGDYDNNYPNSFNTFIRKCVDNNELLFVTWIK